MKSSQKGFSLIEILIALGIMAALLLLVFIIVPRVQAQLKVNETGEQLTGMVATLKGLYATSPGYDQLTTERAIKGRVYYDNMPHTPTSVTNAWDGSVIFGPDSGTDGSYGPRYTNDVPARRFNITFTNVPDNECAKLASGVGTNFSLVVVNGNQDPLTAGSEPVLNRLNGSTDTTMHPERALEQCVLENNSSAGMIPVDGISSGTVTGNVIQFIGQ